MKLPTLSGFSVLFCLLLAGMSAAEEPATAESDEADYEVEIRLSEFCEADPEVNEPPTSVTGEKTFATNPVSDPRACAPRTPPVTDTSAELLFSDILGAPENPNDPEPKRRKKAACKMLKDVGLAAGDQPAVTRLTDAQGRKWKIKFYFAPTRTKYFGTDVHLRSSTMNVVLRNFAFEERTSMGAYNPATWKGLDTLFKWIDEPTNKMVLKFERGKNAFFINVYHPKFLTMDEKTYESSSHVEGEIDGKGYSHRVALRPEEPTNDEQVGLKIQNTHRQMDWQVGYERQVPLIVGKKGALVYQPHVAVGISTGKTLSSYTDDQGNTSTYEAKGGFQGMNATVGQALEYQRGRWSVFADQSLTLAQLRHDFMDGTAFYDMRYMTFSVGMGFQINKTQKKKK